MKLRCLIFGCKWGKGHRFPVTGEWLILQRCERCGTERVMSE